MEDLEERHSKQREQQVQSPQGRSMLMCLRKSRETEYLKWKEREEINWRAKQGPDQGGICSHGKSFGVSPQHNGRV